MASSPPHPHPSDGPVPTDTFMQMPMSVDGSAIPTGRAVDNATPFVWTGTHVMALVILLLASLLEYSD